MSPGNIFHSNSVGIPSIRFYILEVIVFRIPFNFALPGRNGSSPIVPVQSTESEKM